MISIHVVIFILFLHWMADFVAQTGWMGQNKSKSNKALLAHVSVYTIVLTIVNPLWALVNGVLHFMVDFVTSRVSSKLWASGKVHWFFTVLGLDQLLHVTCLLVTYMLLVS